VQESVWNYPRPPRVEDIRKHIKVIFNHVFIAETHNAKRVLERNRPPVYYISSKEIKTENIAKTDRHTVCEWKV
jgi:uncharacterized protein (DUF427 family)